MNGERGSRETPSLFLYLKCYRYLKCYCPLNNKEFSGQ